MNTSLQPAVSFGSYSSSELLRFAADEELFAALAQRRGKWFIVADFEGRIRGWEFRVQPRCGFDDTTLPAWQPVPLPAWRSSLSQAEYQQAVSSTRDTIAAGGVYQANICRVLSAKVAQPGHPAALATRFAQYNPAPFLGFLHVPAQTAGAAAAVWLASASPELFLRLTPQTDGSLLAVSSPIKGTAATSAGITAKDEAENIMITDLMRNDFSRFCQPGSVEVRDLLRHEQHPGLVHLVSSVLGTVAPETLARTDFWRHLLAVTLPPGSVSGAPKRAAIELIGALEQHHRGPYCGAFGWVDPASGEAELAVGIRCFWWEQNCHECDGPALHFGTGAGITWGSQPEREWHETELKAARLVRITAGL